MVILRGNVLPQARAQYDRGRTNPSLPLERMVMTLVLSPKKQAALDRLLDRLHDPASQNFHRWLKPGDFGERFGLSDSDLAMVAGWLTSHGFTIDEVGRGRIWINFSGSVAEVERAFHVEIHDYFVNGKTRHANDRDPAIPRALANLVKGIVSLNNFPRSPMHGNLGLAQQAGINPEYTSGSTHYMAPADFSTIYDVDALYDAGINGTGQSIAIVGRTHPPSSDWTSFRSMMDLSVNPPGVIVNGPDPGDLGSDEDLEADLDVEWSGAVAPFASILFVISKSTEATDGVDLSAQYIVDNNLAPVMSTSFGSCEAAMTQAENNFFNSLWQQAAAQGITSFVSSGDSGAAGCSLASATTGTMLAVNGLASTPYNVAVGGSEFNEGTGDYWNSSNGPGYSSALSYIPETAWNESGDVSGGSDLWATGGGASSLYAKPSWQAATGVPADGKRDVPDVSLSAAGHDAYLVESLGELYAVRGTSASSPSFAGLMALVVQQTGQWQGNANVRFYQLGSAQFGAGGVEVFHAIASGNNSVPGVTGYSCMAGYSPVIGLGSVDAAVLVDNWTADFTISASPVSLSVLQGGTGTSTITTEVFGDFSSPVTLSASGLPTGVKASFSPNPISAPGSGTSTMTLTASASSPTGTYAVTVSGLGDSLIQTTAVTLFIPQTFTITSSVSGSGGAIAPGSTAVASGGTVTLTVTPNTGYHLASLTDNGVNVTSSVANSTYTIPDITANHTVVAAFAVNMYTVTAVVSSGSGSISPASASVPYGGSATFTFTPAGGYVFSSLLDNGSAAAATPAGNGNYTYTILPVTSNHQLQVSFAAAAPVPELGTGAIAVTAVLLIAWVFMSGSRKLTRLSGESPHR